MLRLSRASSAFIIALCLLFTSVYAVPNIEVLDPLPALKISEFSDDFLDYLENPEKYGGRIPLAHEVRQTKNTAPYSLPTRSTLPSKYDTRDYITPAKNQGRHGTCWAFAALGALEGATLKSQDITYDFSEAHMAMMLGQPKNYNNKSIPFPNLLGFGREYNGGGNRDFATVYLTQGFGPVDENKFPYDPELSWEYDIDSAKAVTSRYQVENVIFIPDHALANPKDPLDKTFDNTVRETHVQALKEYIYQYGAVSTSINVAFATADISGDDPYYNPESGGYYLPQSSDINFPNHDVVLVGWDDDFAVNSFNEGSRPPKKGAFLVKNSYGNASDEPYSKTEGCFWISYYDKFVGNGSTVFTEVTKTPPNKKIYSYDEFGRWGSIGYDNGVETYFGNIFTAENPGEEKLYAIGLYVEDATILPSMEVYVVPDLYDEDVIKGTSILQNYDGGVADYAVYPILTLNSVYDDPLAIYKRDVSYADINLPGFYTLNLDEPVDIVSDNFLVIVKMVQEDIAVIPLELRVTRPSGEVDVPAVGDYNQSFIGQAFRAITEGNFEKLLAGEIDDINNAYTDNIYFQDIYGGNVTNVALRAYTTYGEDEPEIVNEIIFDNETKTATVDVTSESKTTAMLIVAAYGVREDGTEYLVKADFTERQNIPANGAKVAMSVASTAEGDISHYRAFLWNGFDGMENLGEFVEVEVE